MVHYLGIVLVIWGLLAQPLMAALPGDIQVHSPVSASAPNIGAIASVSDLDHTLPVPAATSNPLNPNEYGKQAAGHSLTASTMPCHQIADSSDLSKPCGKCLTGHCDSGCLSASHCGSTCSAPALSMISPPGSYSAWPRKPRMRWLKSKAVGPAISPISSARCCRPI